MDVRIEERDEAGNLMATYAGSAEKGGSGGRWDVIVSHHLENFLARALLFHDCHLERSRPVGRLHTSSCCFWMYRVSLCGWWWSWAKCIRFIEILPILSHGCLI